LNDASVQSSLFRFGDFTELFEGGFEVFDDFLGENVGIEEFVRFFAASSRRPEDVAAGFVAVVTQLKIGLLPFRSRV
jgi:hypothetical protein